MNNYYNCSGNYKDYYSECCKGENKCLGTCSSSVFYNVICKCYENSKIPYCELKFSMLIIWIILLVIISCIVLTCIKTYYIRKNRRRIPISNVYQTLENNSINTNTNQNNNASILTEIPPTYESIPPQYISTTDT